MGYYDIQRDVRRLAREVGRLEEVISPDSFLFADVSTLAELNLSDDAPRRLIRRPAKPLAKVHAQARLALAEPPVEPEPTVEPPEPMLFGWHFRKPPAEHTDLRLYGRNRYASDTGVNAVGAAYYDAIDNAMPMSRIAYGWRLDETGHRRKFIKYRWPYEGNMFA